MNKTFQTVSVVVLALLGATVPEVSWGGAPELIPVQGVLTDASGAAVPGPVTVKFTLYDAQVGGAALWTEDQTITPDNGFFSAYLGEVNKLDLQLFKNNMVVWLGVKVGDSDELPRVYLGSSPFTAFAQYCGTVPAHTHPFGEITGVLPADKLPTGVVVGAQECQGTARVAAIDADGNLVCKEGAAVYTAGKGIAIDSLAISVKPCTDNQFLLWSGNDWTCTAYSPGSGTVTSITAGSGLSGGTITTSGTIGISAGGVTNAMLQNSSITVAADGNTISGGGQAALGGASPTLYVKAGGIGTAQIADGVVTDAKISSVAGSKVTGSVASATAAVTAVTANTALAVSPGSIVTASFAPTAKAPLCGAADSAASALTAATADDSSALAGHPGSYFLNAANLTGTLSPDRIADGALPGAKLASKAVTGGKIADTTIVAGNIADAAVVDRTLDNGVIFAKVKNSTGTDQFDVTHGSNGLLIAGAGATSVSFDPASHKVTVSSTAGTGTVTSISQSNGIILTPSTITGTGSVAIDPTYTQRRVSSICNAGSAITEVSQTGQVTCTSWISNANSASDLATGSVLSATKGGTGLSGYTTGDLLYASGAATLSKLADVVPGNALLSGGAGVAPAWGKVDLGTHVSGTLPVARGGTGSSTLNFVDLTSDQSIAGTKTFSTTIAGSISGNAATVTNGVYTTGSYSDPSWITSLSTTKLSGAVPVANGGTGNTTAGTAGYVCYSDGSKYNFTPSMRVDSSSVESPNIILGYSGNAFTAGVKGASVGGGGSSFYENKVTDDYGTVAGGRSNQAGDNAGTISDRMYATVAGGFVNKATGAYSVVGGGYGNNATAEDAVVSGGLNNDANGARSFLGGGEENTATGMYSTVGGGRMVTAGGDYSVIGGGYNNQVTAESAAVGGGNGNLASGPRSVVAGGSGSGAAGQYSAVGGGDRNTATGDWSAIAGGVTNNTYDYNTFIGGGASNVAGVFGGTMNEGSNSAVVGGASNTASGQMSIVGGGQSNTASALYAAVLGGYLNEATGNYSSAVGGYDNASSGNSSFVGGGYSNRASGAYAAIGGGYDNTVTGNYSTVAGGYHNYVTGARSFAAGSEVDISRDGCFLWGDASGGTLLTAGANNRVLFRSTGGFYIYTNSILSTGVYIAAGGGSWASVSAREKKENFAPVDTGLLLDRLDAAEITSWNYKSQDSSIRHIGLMADDFNSLLPGLGGEGMDHINNLDADGVAIAAIKGLITENKRLQARDRELGYRVEALEAQNRDLRMQLSSAAIPSDRSGTTGNDPRIDALESRLRELEKKSGREKAGLWWLAAFGVVAGVVAVTRKRKSGSRLT